MYKIPDAKLTHPDNALGIFELDEEKFNQTDLDKFYKVVAPYIPQGYKPQIARIDGASAQGPLKSAGAEITLDLDMAIPLVWPQQTKVLEAIAPKNGLFNLFLDAIDGSYCHYQGGDDLKIDGNNPNEDCGKFKPTNVISFSYGLSEAHWPAKYLSRQCHEFMKLGLQGVTMVVSSGDYGVARKEGYCLGPKQDIFTPHYVASCPWVTAVGSTVLPEKKQPGDKEIATESFSSGGGFSNVFLRPSYQNSTLNRYSPSLTFFLWQ